MLSRQSSHTIQNRPARLACMKRKKRGWCASQGVSPGLEDQKDRQLHLIMKRSPGKAHTHLALANHQPLKFSIDNYSFTIMLGPSFCRFLWLLEPNAEQLTCLYFYLHPGEGG